MREQALDRCRHGLDQCRIGHVGQGPRQQGRAQATLHGQRAKDHQKKGQGDQGLTQSLRALKNLHATDIVVDTVNGRIRTTIRLPLRSLADLEAYTAKIEELSEIQTVTAVAVQLPVRQAP